MARDARDHGARARGCRVRQTRREFITQAAAASAAIGIAGCAPATTSSPTPAPSPPAAAGGDPTFKDLAMLALDAAKSAGASYADVRISRNRNQAIFTREQRVQNLVDNETFGFGVRVLVGGAWGFAASRDLTRDEVARVARQAVTQARANRTTMVRPVTLAPVTPTPDGSWRSPARLDPFDVPSKTRPRSCSRRTRRHSGSRARDSSTRKCSSCAKRKLWRPPTAHTWCRRSFERSPR